MTTEGLKQNIPASFCASCGKPVRWETKPGDKRCNEEFCADCRTYAAKVVRLDMMIEEAERSAAGKASDLSAQLTIEKLVTERAVAIRILDTIRTGVKNEFMILSERNGLFGMKHAKN